MKFIKAKKLKDCTITGNKMLAKGEFIDTEKIETSDISNNVQIIPNNKSKKRWYEKPVGIVILAVIAIVIAAIITYCFGLT
jgi:hypothetical protein